MNTPCADPEIFRGKDGDWGQRDNFVCQGRFESYFLIILSCKVKELEFSRERGGGAIECDSLKNAQTKLFLHKKYFKEKNSNRKSASNNSSLQIKYNFKM